MGVLLKHPLAAASRSAPAPSSPSPLPTRDRLANPFAAIEAIVLLAGTLRPTPLLAGINRSVLDLPLKPGFSLLNQWMQNVESLAQLRGGAPLTVRILLNEPRTLRFNHLSSSARILVECDPQEYRGTGGVLYDIAAHYPDDSYILVGSATTITLDDFAALTTSLTDLLSDVAILTHDDGTSNCPMLIRCSALRGIKNVGFVDFKEQAIPAITAHHQVKVVRRPFSNHSARTREGYLHAVKHFHWQQAGKTVAPDPFVEDWQSTFAIVEPGALVAPSAVIHDSIVLDGAKVDSHAVIVRSVICPGAVISKNETVSDRVVTSKSREV